MLNWQHGIACSQSHTFRLAPRNVHCGLVRAASASGQFGVFTHRRAGVPQTQYINSLNQTFAKNAPGARENHFHMLSQTRERSAINCAVTAFFHTHTLNRMYI